MILATITSFSLFSCSLLLSFPFFLSLFPLPLSFYPLLFLSIYMSLYCSLFASKTSLFLSLSFFLSFNFLVLSFCLLSLPLPLYLFFFLPPPPLFLSSSTRSSFFLSLIPFYLCLSLCSILSFVFSLLSFSFLRPLLPVLRSSFLYPFLSCPSLFLSLFSLSSFTFSLSFASLLPLSFFSIPLSLSLPLSLFSLCSPLSLFLVLPLSLLHPSLPVLHSPFICPSLSCSSVPRSLFSSSPPPPPFPPSPLSFPPLPPLLCFLPSLLCCTCCFIYVMFALKCHHALLLTSVPLIIDITYLVANAWPMSIYCTCSFSCIMLPPRHYYALWSIYIPPVTSIQLMLISHFWFLIHYLFSILEADAWKPLESYNYNKEEINQVHVIGTVSDILTFSRLWPDFMLLISTSVFFFGYIWLKKCSWILWPILDYDRILMLVPSNKPFSSVFQ